MSSSVRAYVSIYIRMRARICYRYKKVLYRGGLLVELFIGSTRCVGRHVIDWDF